MSRPPTETLTVLWSGGAWTREELHRATGLSRSTVSAQLAALDAAGLLRWVGTSATGGRPSTKIGLEPSVGALVTVHLVGDVATVSVADLMGVPHEAASVAWTGSDPAGALADKIGRVVQRALPGAAPAVVLLVPGRDVAREGLDGRAGLAHELAGVLHVRVEVRPEAELALAAEVDDGERDVMYVVTEPTVRVACRMGGAVVVGADGVAGAVGSERFDVPGGTSVLGLEGRPTLDEVIARAGELVPHDEARRVAGRHLGAAVAAMAALVDPRLVVVAGGAARCGEYLAGVREEVFARMPPARALHLEVRWARLEPREAVVAGGARLARRVLERPERRAGLLVRMP